MNLLEKMQELAMENHKITYSSGLIGEGTYEKYIWSHITQYTFWEETLGDIN